MLDERKAAILRAVVEEYIRTAQPVGSAHIARDASGFAVSSATVRNEMGILEREGYLTQPHTSAGRIPTDKGYRFFVDAMAEPGLLQPAQSQQVRDFFATAHGELERMLGDTSRLLSNLTDYAAVIVAPISEVALVRSIQVVALGPRVALVVAVLSDGVVEKATIEVDGPVSEEDLARVGSRVARAVTGHELGRLPALAASDDPLLDRFSDRVMSALTNLRRSESGQVFVGGAARMAQAFDAVGTIRQVLSILEQQFVLVSLLKDVLDRGLTVAIGAEHGVERLADCSVVVAPYTVEGERVGTVGVLGPTRMHYDQALAAVAVVSRRLGDALSEG
jgi:heat-inducible transcriptional repressor